MKVGDKVRIKVWDDIEHEILYMNEREFLIDDEDIGLSTFYIRDVIIPPEEYTLTALIMNVDTENLNGWTTIRTNTKRCSLGPCIYFPQIMEKLEGKTVEMTFKVVDES